MPRAHTPIARETARLLGKRISVARRERRWTMAELAERVGVSLQTMRRIERGDLGVSTGLVFEAAAIVGVPLFSPDPERRMLEARHLDTQLALLPERVRRPRQVRSDF